jgi:diguanylate cyclase (GGDEF)-like protein
MQTRAKLPREDTDDLGDQTGALLDGDESNDAHEPTDPTSARVLLVHDDHSARAALRDALELNGFVVDEDNSGASAIGRITRTRPHLLLLDAASPCVDGFTTCQRLRELPQCAELPVLMITSLDARQIDRAFAVGASDYVTEPLHPNVVVQRVRRTLEADRAERNARHLTHTDSLTGLPNRTHSQTTLQDRLAPTGNPSQVLAVVLLDLDRFKFVNDTLGHDIGDRLLRAASRRLVRAVGAGAYVARLGGDEFAVVLENVSPSIAASAARTITTELAKPYALDGHDIFVRANIGIAHYRRDGDDAGTLLRHAEAAMYRAKRSSHRLAFYEAAMEGSAREHLQLESDLHHAIDHGELVLHYQPEMEAATGRMVAVEALVRWQHPSYGLIGPDRFIPMAEEVGLIGPIGAWVLDSASAQLKAWRDAGHSLRVAVNFSAGQLQDRGIADVVATALDRFGLQADDLVVEITESVWLDPQSAAIDNLHRLKRLGVRLAIDDFGTGYASLSYLKHMPVDILKVDRSFVTCQCRFKIDTPFAGMPI